MSRPTLDTAPFVDNPHVRVGEEQVIVIGGGFTGLNAAKTLATHNEVHVTDS
jgi:heterodisulfide reductase subunit A-like polyferredoxin